MGDREYAHAPLAHGLLYAFPRARSPSTSRPESELVKQLDLGFEHRELQNLASFALASGQVDVHRPFQKGRVEA